MQNRFQNTLKYEVWTSKLDVKIDPKWGVWGIILGGRGRHFRTTLGVWADSGSQMQSWAVLVAVLVANMAPT